MKRFLFAAGAAVLIVAACSSDKGSPVSGPVDTHCTLPDGGTIAQEVNQASCAGSGGDAGVADYGDTLYNSEGDDDDCKYHVRFSNSDIEQNKDVNFTVVATVKAPPGGAATGANIIAEVFLNDTHPAPNSGQHVTESPPGTYNVGPIRFDAAGRWTVRFHLHEDCADEAEDSPHGHVAFYLDVP